MVKKVRMRRGGAAPSPGPASTPAKTPAPTTGETGSGSSNMKYILIGVLGLVMIVGLYFMYSNSDYIRCRSEGKGHEFCMSKIKTKIKNVKRDEKRQNMK